MLFKLSQILRHKLSCSFGYKIKAIQTNWGKGYRAFTNLLMSHGITYRYSCPHTHEQNGVAERKHRHIVENGLTLLVKASMPLKYWDKAFRAAVFLYNRLPTSVLHWKTPLEAFLHSSPNYSIQSVWMCMLSKY